MSVSSTLRQFRELAHTWFPDRRAGAYAAPKFVYYRRVGHQFVAVRYSDRRMEAIRFIFLNMGGVLLPTPVCDLLLEYVMPTSPLEEDVEVSGEKLEMKELECGTPDDRASILTLEYVQVVYSEAGVSLLSQKQQVDMTKNWKGCELAGFFQEGDNKVPVLVLHRTQLVSEHVKCFGWEMEKKRQKRPTNDKKQTKMRKRRKNRDDDDYEDDDYFAPREHAYALLWFDPSGFHTRQIRLDPYSQLMLLPTGLYLLSHSALGQVPVETTGFWQIHLNKAQWSQRRVPLPDVLKPLVYQDYYGGLCYGNAVNLAEVTGVFRHFRYLPSKSPRYWVRTSSPLYIPASLVRPWLRSRPSSAVLRLAEAIVFEGEQMVWALYRKDELDKIPPLLENLRKRVQSLAPKCPLPRLRMKRLKKGNKKDSPS